MAETSDPKTSLLLDNGQQINSGFTVSPAVRQRQRRQAAFVISVAFVVITGVLLVITLAITLSVSPNGIGGGEPSNCITPDVCNSNILNYIDDSFDPCEDFFNYSCGNWLSANPLNGRDQWDIFQELITDNYKHISGYLAKPIQDSDPGAIKKSKYIYSACTNVEFIRNNSVKHLRDLIKNAGGWVSIGIIPDVGWDINEDLANDHYLGSSAFFSSVVSPDNLNSSKPVITIMQGGLSLDSPQQYYDIGGTHFQYLVRKIKTVLDTIKTEGATGNTSLLAWDIALYERVLALNSLTETELRDNADIYHPMELKQISNLFNLDWVQYFKNISTKAGFMLNFTDETVVIVETPGYFRNISTFVFNTTNLYRTMNYAKWQLLYSEYDIFGAFLSNGIEKIHNTGFSATDAVDLFCAQTVENLMPLAVARPFVKEFITTEVIDQVNRTINNIFKAFIERIIAKDWLDGISKNRCIDKVNAISTRIAYPDFINSDSRLDEYYEELPINSSNNIFEIVAAFKKFQYFQQLSVYMTGRIDKNVWTEAPSAVNAYYASPFNQITILAGILRIPFFAINWPPFLLYGSIGTVLGHELTHGFDDQGREYDKNGNRIQWWKNDSITQFNERVQCLVEQYDQYIFQGYQVDGELTLGENIADNGGIHTAFGAYKNAAGDDKSLIDGHTRDQLFFVAFAQLYCSRYSDAYLDTSIQTDVHSPDPIRVLGTLKNSREFATAFKCSDGSTMNPTSKCEVW